MNEKRCGYHFIKSFRNKLILYISNGGKFHQRFFVERKVDKFLLQKTFNVTKNSLEILDVLLIAAILS